MITMCGQKRLRHECLCARAPKHVGDHECVECGDTWPRAATDTCEPERQPAKWAEIWWKTPLENEAEGKAKFETLVAEIQIQDDIEAARQGRFKAVFEHAYKKAMIDLQSSNPIPPPPVERSEKSQEQAAQLSWITIEHVLLSITVVSDHTSAGQFDDSCARLVEEGLKEYHGIKNVDADVLYKHTKIEKHPSGCNCFFCQKAHKPAAGFPPSAVPPASTSAQTADNSAAVEPRRSTPPAFS